MDDAVRQGTRRGRREEGVRTVARVGYAVNGLVHLLVGWLALQLAWGSAGTRADESGAFATLAGNALGRGLLWVCVAGFAGLALWQLAEAASGRRDTGDRVKAAAKAVLYLALGWTALRFATEGASAGGGSSGEGQTADLTAQLMSTQWGALLVGAAGLVLVGVGTYHVHKGWTRGFLEDLESHPGRYAEVAGRIGYAAKGVALGTVGILFGVAAVRNDPGEATGLDHALRTLAEAPFGSALLTAVAVGLAAYGLYSFARARHARI